MKWQTEMQLRGGGLLDDHRFDALADALAELDEADDTLEDTDLTASLADGWVIVAMVVTANDPADAIRKTVVTVRAAIQKIGDFTLWLGAHHRRGATVGSSGGLRTDSRLVLAVSALAAIGEDRPAGLANPDLFRIGASVCSTTCSCSVASSSPAPTPAPTTSPWTDHRVPGPRAVPPLGQSRCGSLGFADITNVPLPATVRTMPRSRSSRIARRRVIRAYAILGRQVVFPGQTLTGHELPGLDLLGDVVSDKDIDQVGTMRVEPRPVLPVRHGDHHRHTVTCINRWRLSNQLREPPAR